MAGKKGQSIRSRRRVTTGPKVVKPVMHVFYTRKPEWRHEKKQSGKRSPPDINCSANKRRLNCPATKVQFRNPLDETSTLRPLVPARMPSNPRHHFDIDDNLTRIEYQDDGCFRMSCSAYIVLVGVNVMQLICLCTIVYLLSP